MRKQLEIGSGYAPSLGFLHLDANPNAPDVDYVGLAHPLPREVVAAGPWDELRAVDVLEHLSYRDADAALAEWRSIVRRGASLYVQVPDAGLIMRTWVALDDRGEAWTAEGAEVEAIVGAEWRLLGGHADGGYVADGDDWRWNAHYSLWTEGKLRARLDSAGWRVAELWTNAHPNLCCWARAR